MASLYFRLFFSHHEQTIYLNFISRLKAIIPSVICKSSANIMRYDPSDRKPFNLIIDLSIIAAQVCDKNFKTSQKLQLEIQHNFSQLLVVVCDV